MNGQTNKRTNLVTTSLLELLIAAKNEDNKVEQREGNKDFVHCVLHKTLHTCIIVLQNILLNCGF